MTDREKLNENLRCAERFLKAQAEQYPEVVREVINEWILAVIEARTRLWQAEDEIKRVVVAPEPPIYEPIPYWQQPGYVPPTITCDNTKGNVPEARYDGE